MNMNINIIPTPKKIQILDGVFNNKSIKLISDLNDNRLIKALNHLPQSDNGVPLEIVDEKKGNEADWINVNKVDRKK